MSIFSTLMKTWRMNMEARKVFYLALFAFTYLSAFGL